MTKTERQRRQRISRARRGHCVSMATRRKISRGLLSSKKAWRAWRRQGLMRRLTGWGHSEKTKRLMSIVRKATPLTSAQKRGLAEGPKALRGVPMPLARKEKIRRAMLGKKHTPAARRKMRESRKRRVTPIKDTQPEKIVFSYLNALGFRVQKHPAFKTLNHQFDFLLPSVGVLIECDGCYWHCCSTHCPLRRNDWRRKQLVRDRKVDKWVSTSSYTLIRFWEHDIRSGVFKGLLQFLFQDLTIGDVAA